MVRIDLYAIAAAVALTVAPGGLQAAANPDIDPKAMAALEKMGAYLRTLNAFRVKAVITDEEVLDDGQKILYSSTADIVAKKPNRLRAAALSERRERLLFYDGKTLTVYAPRVGYYASIAAPPTTAQLAKALDDQYDISLPLEDLFLWGSAGWSSSAILGVMDVGPSAVEGTTCEQYALRQKDIDWQIWVQQGDFPLPRRLVITTRTDEARPQHTAVYTWDLAPSFNEASFTFQPPPGVSRVPLAKSSLAAADSPKK